MLLHFTVHFHLIFIWTWKKDSNFLMINFLLVVRDCFKQDAKIICSYVFFLLACKLRIVRKIFYRYSAHSYIWYISIYLSIYRYNEICSWCCFTMFYSETVDSLCIFISFRKATSIYIFITKLSILGNSENILNQYHSYLTTSTE